jgi:hypothetical protein
MKLTVHPGTSLDCLRAARSAMTETQPERAREAATYAAGLLILGVALVVDALRRLRNRESLITSGIQCSRRGDNERTLRDFRSAGERRAQ